MLVSDKQKMISVRIAPTSSRQLLGMMLSYARDRVKEGSVETSIFCARRYLGTAGLNEERRRVIGGELDALLSEGYANEARNCLEEARQISAYTEVDDLIEMMYEYLGYSRINANDWLDEYGSSAEGIEALREEGRSNRNKNLVKVRLVSGIYAARTLMSRIGY
jgi:hypothetical protein